MTNHPAHTSCISIDFGSTSIKVARYTYVAGRDIHEELTAPWIDYIPDTATDAHGNPFRLLFPEHLNTLLHKLHTAVDCVRGNDRMPFLVLSGLTNNLAVRSGSKTVILLDDPSLETPVTEEQRIILSRTFGSSEIRPQSALMKLLSVKNETGALTRTTFGEAVPFETLSFSTILGVVAGALTKTRSHFTIPLDDLRAFGNATLTAGQTEALLASLGVSPSQCRIAPSRLTTLPGKETVYQINDFHAEIDMISELFTRCILPKDATVIALDTVGKLVARYATLPKTIDGIGYVTMRNCARIIKTWMHTLYPECSSDALYATMETILTRENPSAPFFYPIHPTDVNGVLRLQNGTMQTLEEHMRAKRDHAETELLIVALARGVGWEFRHMIEDVWTENGIREAPIVLYGGLTAHGQTGWIRTFSETFPPTPLSVLSLASGNLAAACAAFRDMGNGSYPPVALTVTPVTTNRTLDADYTLWKTYRP